MVGSFIVEYWVIALGLGLILDFFLIASNNLNSVRTTPRWVVSKLTSSSWV